MNPFDSLKASPLQFRYPGRFLIIGKDADSYVVVYGATGRSPSSLARRFVQKGNGIFMGGIDDTVKQGNQDLLEYPAVRIFDNGIVVANGKHIEQITELQSRDARQQLSYALAEEAYEPDEYRTPRITGCIIESSKGMDGALHIVRSASDGIDHASWSVSFESGKGEYVGTYIGEDVKPTPSFAGVPLSVPLQFGSAKSTAQAIFDSYTPPQGGIDYRVGVIAVYKKLGEQAEIAIVNRIS
ncbi:MAG: IMP cyclohydrolase [Parcubacteria group bacterium Greene0714_7]|nr:MAG: IMP cyclohydrolase [Parcubacteria group bacterium Greene0714_7]